ncbi:hypothetical protein [Robertmurraya massiliosenegalensis]|nr:hypothetical protein [Robertmurraya massiliosenegalensis]
MEKIADLLAKEGYKIENRDYSLETFYHYATGVGNKSPIALFIDAFDDEVPVEVKAEEYTEYLSEIRFNNPNMRLIINLPSQFKHMKQMQRNLMSLSIYDFHFEDNFSIQSILGWIETPKTLADVKDLVKDLIVHENSKEKVNDNLKYKVIEPNEKQSSPDLELSEIEIEEEEDGKSNQKEEKFPGIKRLADSFSFSVHLPKTKVIEKYVTLNQQSVAFISLSKGAGSTFHSLNFASFLSDKGRDVGVYEYPIHSEGRTYLSDVFDFFDYNGDTLKKQQISVPHLICDRKPIFLEQAPIYENIHIYATDYESKCITDFTNEQLLRYINTGKHSIKIMDFGYIPSANLNYESSFIDLLSVFHHVVVVTDLMPTMINPNIERLAFFQEYKEDERYQTEVTFLLNRYESYLPKKEIKQLNLANSHQCISLPYEHIFKAYYDKKIPYDISRDVEEELIIVYDGLLKEMGLEEEIKYRKKKKRGFFSRV